jgi:hypothetical protein
MTLIYIFLAPAPYDLPCVGALAVRRTSFDFACERLNALVVRDGLAQFFLWLVSDAEAKSLAVEAHTGAKAFNHFIAGKGQRV